MISVHPAAVDPGGYVEYGPLALGLNSVSTKSVAITTGATINLGGMKSFTLIVELLNTGGTNPTVGDTDILLDMLSSDGALVLATKTLLGALLTRGTTSGGGTRNCAGVLSWDYLMTTDGSLIAGSSTSVDTNVLGNLGPCRLRFDVNTATDGTTTSLASVYLRASP